MIEPKEGQIWFVKIGENTVLSRMEVREISPLVVGLIGEGSMKFKSPYYYQRSDVEFIETCNDSDKA